jgi:hypothetical protein
MRSYSPIPSWRQSRRVCHGAASDYPEPSFALGRDAAMRPVPNRPNAHSVKQNPPDRRGGFWCLWFVGSRTAKQFNTTPFVAWAGRQAFPDISIPTSRRRFRCFPLRAHHGTARHVPVSRLDGSLSVVNLARARDNDRRSPSGCSSTTPGAALHGQR